MSADQMTHPGSAEAEGTRGYPAPPTGAWTTKRAFVVAGGGLSVALLAGAAFFAGTQAGPAEPVTAAAVPDVPAVGEGAAPAPDPGVGPGEASETIGTTGGATGLTPEEDAPIGAPDEPAQFERDYIDKVAGNILEDIATIDERLGDGIQVASAMNLLADSYSRLLTSPAPTGVDEADYYARVATLEQFARDAADLYEVDPIASAATYSVVRDQTQPLLDQINGWLGTSHTVPAS
jgi:hypothetical protein